MCDWRIEGELRAGRPHRAERQTIQQVNHVGRPISAVERRPAAESSAPRIGYSFGVKGA